MSANFKSRLLSQDLLIGTFVKTPSPMLCEILGDTELDLVCLDAEHSPFDRLVQDQCLYALRNQQMPALVRVPSALPEHTLNALDCGATGVVIPHVKSAAEAKAAAAAAHFGAGGRGYAGSTRAAGYTTKKMPDHLANSAAQTTVVAQIEDVEALDEIDAIAAVDGIDCLFIGMIDLTVALAADSPKAPEVIAAAEKICAAATAANRRLGIFVPSAEDIPFWQERGVSLFLLSSDHSFLRQGAANLVASAR
jgi:2-keto-3-deoxy-L-rhamnonate aldolase RhmA